MSADIERRVFDALVFAPDGLTADDLCRRLGGITKGQLSESVRHMRESVEVDYGLQREGEWSYSLIPGAIRPAEKVMAQTSKHPLYSIWKGMHNRCTNANGKTYKHYGGRGIKVCDRWKDLDAFAADVGPRPSLGHSIDRINNDGDYEPSNVRWATALEQVRNRRPFQKRAP